MSTIRRISLAVLFLFPFIAVPANSEELDLGFRTNLGTYTILVQFPDIGERNLTLDTGASFTVLNRKDVQRISGVTEKKSNIRLFLPFYGKAVPASFIVVPYMRIGNCILRDRLVVVTDLPEGRPGALGMNDLEELAPFTFTGDGTFQFQCSTK